MSLNTIAYLHLFISFMYLSINLFIYIFIYSFIYLFIVSRQLQCIVLFLLAFTGCINNSCLAGVYQSFLSSFTCLLVVPTGLPTVITYYYTLTNRLYSFLVVDLSSLLFYLHAPVVTTCFSVVCQSFLIIYWSFLLVYQLFYVLVLTKIQL